MRSRAVTAATVFVMIIAFAAAVLAQEVVPPAATLDAREIVRRALQHDDANDHRARDYTFIQEQVVRELDGDGKVKKTHTQTSEVMTIYDRTVERVIERDGKPLDAKAQAKQEEKINKIIRERESETAAQKQERLAKYDKQRAEGRAFVGEVADAYNFTMADEEPIDGHQAFVIDAEPRADFHPKTPNGKWLPKFRGRIWIDKSELQVVKLQAEATDTVSFGWFLARIGRGSGLTLEQTRVNDEVWLPRHFAVKVGGRALLFKKFNVDIDVTFRDYKKFRSDTKILSVGEIEQH